MSDLLNPKGQNTNDCIFKNEENVIQTFVDARSYIDRVSFSTGVLFIHCITVTHADIFMSPS